MANKRRKPLGYIKRRTPQEQAIVDNQNTLFDYMMRMQKIATSMFEWQNLPTTMDERWLERSLFLYGTAAMFWSDKYSAYINTECTAAGNPNIYGVPTQINCHSFDFDEMREVYNSPGAPGRTKGEEAILVLNTRDREPTVGNIMLFAERLADAQRTADINMNAQRTPVIILTDEDHRYSMINAYKQYKGNIPVIVADKNSFDFENFKVEKTEAPFVADKVMDYKQRIWNEFLDFLGVNNTERYKKERMVASENEQNNEEVNYNLQSFLLPRQKAAAEFNEKFGLWGDKALKVRVRSDLENIIKKENSIVKDFMISDLEDSNE